MAITAFFEWIETRLDRGAWFRRCYVLGASVLVWHVTHWAMRFAEANAARSGADVALVIGAVSAVPGAVVAFAFQQYMAAK